MPCSFLDRSLRQYLDDAAAKLPCPGGGSVAACAAALAGSLVSMVLNFTVGKKTYREHEETNRRLLAENEALRLECALLIERDSDLYERMTAAGRDDPAGAQRLLKESADMHRGLAGAAVRILEWSRTLLETGSRNLVSDAGIAAVLAGAAFDAARVNAAVNCRYVEDPEFVRACAAYFEAEAPRAARLAAEVRDGALAVLARPRERSS